MSPSMLKAAARSPGGGCGSAATVLPFFCFFSYPFGVQNSPVWDSSNFEVAVPERGFLGSYLTCSRIPIGKCPKAVVIFSMLVSESTC